MSIMQKISLRGMRFLAFHGYYPEEQLTGTEFLADVETMLEVTGTGDDELSETVNYEVIREVVSEHMCKPRKLIESVAHDILREMHLKFPDLELIVVRIRKMHPPLSSEVDHAEIELTYSRK